MGTSRTRWSLLIGVALGAGGLAACGSDPDEGSAPSSAETSSSSPSSSPSSASPSSEPSESPVDEVALDSDFADAGNPNDWDTGDFGSGLVAGITDGRYSVALPSAALVTLRPDAIESVSARFVSWRIDARATRGAWVNYGITCMQQDSASGELADSYLLTVSNDGLAGISMKSGDKNRKFGPPVQVPAWDDEDPPPLLFGCDSTRTKDVQFIIATADGKPIVRAASGTKRLMEDGVTRLLMIGDGPPKPGVDFTNIDLTLEETRPVG